MFLHWFVFLASEARFHWADRAYGRRLLMYVAHLRQLLPHRFAYSIQKVLKALSILGPERIRVWFWTESLKLVSAPEPIKCLGIWFDLNPTNLSSLQTCLSREHNLGTLDLIPLLRQRFGPVSWSDNCRLVWYREPRPKCDDTARHHLGSLKQNRHPLLLLPLLLPQQIILHSQI